MLTVKDIASVIEDFAPLSIQESWDNSGLIIGSPSQEVHGILLGFDCTPELVDEAVAVGADLIVTHHPLIFNGLKKISPDDPTGLAVMKAIAGGVAVYAAHTTADKVIGGVSGAMARRLGLTGVEVLDLEPGGYGLGAVGNLPEPMDGASFIEYVRSRFALKALRSSRLPEVPVSRVAMCGGAGGSLIEDARKAGAQAYLCGDVSYHHFFTTKDFMVIDIGHFEGEVEIVDILFTLLQKNFPTFAIRTSRNLVTSNPVYYY
jgi:dinuclear metal center YbgI/SA1388 family protein